MSARPNPARADKSELVGVLLVEDDAMVRGWVKVALEQSEFRLVGEAGSLETGLARSMQRAPAVLLVDYRLPDGRGTELVRTLRRRGLRMPVLIMTATPEPGLNEMAREAGAQGTVLKSGCPGKLVDALRLVVRGWEKFDPAHPRRPPGLAVLSPREREVLRLVAAGATNPEIAAELGVSVETVKTLLARACAKLGVRRRAEAVAVAHELGLL